jgi:antitoxin (DNA-binding transcriptional repressor) of toxin-antitoxin stability system
MENLVGLKELRENVDTYVAEVQKGKSFIIVRRSMPIFKLSPPNEDSELWERVIDFTKIRKGGVEIKELLSRL